MKAKIAFLTLICLNFAFLLALPGLAGTWRNDFEDEKVFEQEKKEGIWDEDLNFFSWEDGECSGESRDPGWWYFLVIGELTWKDYSAECKVKLVEDFGNGEFGIALRRTPWQQPSYDFGLFPSQNMAKIATMPLSVITQEKFDVEKDIWYKLKAVSEGKKLEFYLNDEFFLKGKDAQFPAGKVGIYIHSIHAHFDDLIIFGDDVEDGGSWDPAKHLKAVEPKGKQATTWGEIKRR
jgi:hypothetical protein